MDKKYIIIAVLCIAGFVFLGVVRDTALHTYWVSDEVVSETLTGVKNTYVAPANVPMLSLNGVANASSGAPLTLNTNYTFDRTLGINYSTGAGDLKINYTYTWSDYSNSASIRGIAHLFPFMYILILILFIVGYVKYGKKE